MAEPYTPTEEDLRAQYAASHLALLGVTFEAAMRVDAVATSLDCGARVAHRASLADAARPLRLND
jgi:hypothetical protein